MPIGTIIGWLLGQLAIGFLLWLHNHQNRLHLTKASILTRQIFAVIGLMLCYTAIGGLVGTFIEMFIS